MKAKTAITYQPIRSISWYGTGVQILLGSLYIALLSQFEIALKPIPVTLQTFAIFSLALFQGAKTSFFSLVAYLFAATIGLPVFPAGYVNPFWILYPYAGYCLSFPLAAYLVGKFTEFKNPPSAIWMLLGLCSAQAVIYIMGVSWLSFSIGWQEALIVGFYPFVLFDIVKILAAFSMKMTVKPVSGLYRLAIKQWEKFYERF